jgi:3-oxoacyl-[acyl-carrier-protein (ACP)] synthase III-like protein
MSIVASNSPLIRTRFRTTGFGNTAAASVLLTLASLLQGRTPVDGTRILLGAFGAGLTWCAAVLEWGVPACEYFAADYTGTGRTCRPSFRQAVSSRPHTPDSVEVTQLQFAG